MNVLNVFSIVIFMASAHAAELQRQTSLLKTAAPDSEQVLLLQKGDEVKVIAKETSEEGNWYRVKSGKIEGFLRTEYVKLSEGDFGYGQKNLENEWNATWLVSTSPLGDMDRRLNLQLGHFFSPGFMLSIKGTTMNNAPQSIFGHDDGYEAGVRASFYQVPENGFAGVSGHLGLFYSKYKRGDSLGDALTYAFSGSTVNRDEVNGAMLELLTGLFIHSNQRISIEILGGLQTYQTRFYTYNTTTGARTERDPASWNGHFVVEGSVGIGF